MVLSRVFGNLRPFDVASLWRCMHFSICERVLKSIRIWLASNFDSRPRTNRHENSRGFCMAVVHTCQWFLERVHCTKERGRRNGLVPPTPRLECKAIAVEREQWSRDRTDHENRERQEEEGKGP